MVLKFTTSVAKIINLDNNIQITVVTGNNKDVISRTRFEEMAHFDKIVYHAKNNKLYERTNSYVLLNGTIKVQFDLEADDNITDNDVDFLNESMQLETTYTDTIIKTSPTQISATYKELHKSNGWDILPLAYEVKCNKSSVNFLEDNTELFCLVNLDMWEVRTISIKANEEITLNKPEIVQEQGATCYLFVAETSQITSGEVVKDLPKYGTIKVKSNTLKIKNTSNKPMKAIVVYK